MTSKFEALLAAARHDGADPQEKAIDRPRQKIKVPEATTRGRAHAPGRRADPSYIQVSAYLPRELHREVKAELVRSGQEFSALVEDLLRRWIAKR